ncbi:MAG: sulfatase-like hydrolase/transferase [Chloroflexota bacterium]
MTQPKRRPNVLVILTDQHRWDCLGAAGNAQVNTPHLDRLAAEGVRFTNSFCPFPVCTPSRYSLLSGLYVHQHGGWTNRCTLPPGTDTFPRLLQRAGYRTKAVGKMHFTPTYLDVGFDELELAEQDGDGRLDDDYHRDLMAHGLLDADDLIDQRREFRQRAPASYWETYGAKTSNLPEGWHSTTWIGDRAVRALEAWTDEPHLLAVSFVKPHHPFDPPAPWDKMYDPDRLNLLPGWLDALPERDREYHAGYFPNAGLTEPALRHVMAHYYATISHVDHQIGRMLDLLQRRGLYDNTLIVFTADHGEYLGFHHMLLKGGPMYDPLVRVPLLVKFPNDAEAPPPGARLYDRSLQPRHEHATPDITAAGTRRDTLVSNVDLAPTILRRAGIEPPPHMRGLNLADPEADRPMLFAESRRGSGYMVRSRTHKLLLGRDPGNCHFFDLQSDPLELGDRFQDPSSGDLIRRLRDALADWLLFDAIPPPYVDEQAPTIRRPNVPDPADTHRQEMLAYFERQVTRYHSG